MLREMSIRDFAIIQEVHLTFDRGFHVLTGETGAGKSILFDALSLVVGGRGSQDFVRHGAKKAEVEALFDISGQPAVHSVLDQLGLSTDGEEHLLIRRDIAQNGKSTCRLNGQIITLAMLKQVGEYLLDIHGQHEHQSLLQVEEHLNWLDAFGGPDLIRQRERYQKAFENVQRVSRELARITADEKEAAQRIDLLSFQKDEIAAARLTPGEDEELAQEHSRLAHAEQIAQHASRAYDVLYGDRQGAELLNQAVGDLEEIVQFDESLQPVLEMVQSAYYQVEEAARQVGRYRDDVEFDPARLSQVEERIHTLDQLKRKYGETVEAIIRHGQEAEKELEQLLNRDERKYDLEQTLTELEATLAEEAEVLTRLRIDAANRLNKRVETELADLNMKGTRFQAAFLGEDESLPYTPAGRDRVEFRIAPNPGEPLRPLVKIASGGELSRIMLALHTIFSDLDGVPTLIFDEVDTGVSGRAAQAIAEKIARLARERQVLCVTHLPQVACMADVHFHIFKESDEEQTRTRVKLLTMEGRTMELARMLGGVEVTDTTKTHALEMLQLAERTKEAIHSR
ncbi:DNA repair protein RecN [Desmospora profundinema]|uniref:DNA repair protein RecN n=1 Tax=Desmospora profundinema TaxID=1571184 RepID=A0ABU1IIQ6_9BACL|nr:DNA repair protein RecN [Desmospora profundinema]MDR6224637.1 DNA repair protein RecN (Recombination protein N) [Desmospora profundinema]